MSALPPEADIGANLQHAALYQKRKWLSGKWGGCTAVAS
jgi:hypothetical protein